uniref:Uncharacterized protein n=1 Tax=Corvus moneduloides TaxID=1196302 RepID=A0A8U7NWN2_CORMO
PPDHPGPPRPKSPRVPPTAPTPPVPPCPMFLHVHNTPMSPHAPMSPITLRTGNLGTWKAHNKEGLGTQDTGMGTWPRGHGDITGRMWGHRDMVGGHRTQTHWGHVGDTLITSTAVVKYSWHMRTVTSSPRVTVPAATKYPPKRSSASFRASAGNWGHRDTGCQPSPISLCPPAPCHHVPFPGHPSHAPQPQATMFSCPLFPHCWSPCPATPMPLSPCVPWPVSTVSLCPPAPVTTSPIPVPPSLYPHVPCSHVFIPLPPHPMWPPAAIHVPTYPPFPHHRSLSPCAPKVPMSPYSTGPAPSCIGQRLHLLQLVFLGEALPDARGDTGLVPKARVSDHSPGTSASPSAECAALASPVTRSATAPGVSPRLPPGPGKSPRSTAATAPRWSRSRARVSATAAMLSQTSSVMALRGQQGHGGTGSLAPRGVPVTPVSPTCRAPPAPGATRLPLRPPVSPGR